jgi:hypothetical protein
MSNNSGLVLVLPPVDQLPVTSLSTLGKALVSAWGDENSLLVPVASIRIEFSNGARFTTSELVTLLSQLPGCLVHLAAIR